MEIQGGLLVDPLLGDVGVVLGPEDDIVLPDLDNGTVLTSKGMTAECKFTAAPPRYSEATLVKKLEELGIGRPSTYAPTIATLTTGRGYIVKGDKEGSKVSVMDLELKNGTVTEKTRVETIGAERSKLLPQEIGMIVSDYLEKNFTDIMDYDFLSKYELLKVQHLQTAHTLNFDIAAFTIDGMNIDEYEKRWLESLETLKQFRLINSEYYINHCLDEGKKVLAEGAQGSMLDIDFGSYPFVTSSSTITAGVCTGLGVAPSRIGRVMGISKAYCTRVGAGPFPTELFDETGAKLCNIGHEFGATTGRPRRCGWIDIPALRYACMLNGVTHLFVTKPDVMNDFDEVKMCMHYSINGQNTDEIPFEFNEVEITPQLQSFPGWKQSLESITQYEKLPQNLLNYLQALEKATGVPVQAVSISPDRKDVLFK